MPVTVRNYEKNEQKVTVRLEAGDWARVPGAGPQDIVAAAGESVSATFPVEAVQWRDGAVTRITAQAGKNADAIQKREQDDLAGAEAAARRCGLLAREYHLGRS